MKKIWIKKGHLLVKKKVISNYFPLVLCLVNKKNRYFSFECTNKLLISKCRLTGCLIFFQRDIFTAFIRMYFERTVRIDILFVHNGRCLRGSITARTFCWVTRPVQIISATSCPRCLEYCNRRIERTVIIHRGVVQGAKIRCECGRNRRKIK